MGLFSHDFCVIRLKTDFVMELKLREKRFCFGNM